MALEFEIIEGLNPSKYLKEIIDIFNSNEKLELVSVNSKEISKTSFEMLNLSLSDGFPKVKELKAKKRFVSDAKDPNYDLPLSNLYKEY